MRIRRLLNSAARSSNWPAASACSPRRPPVQLLVAAGDNPERLRTEAAFATPCGAAPVPASSGRTDRHRLGRGGDRQANRARHMIAAARMRCCPRTRAYGARRTQRGLTKKDIIRCLKRLIAREVYHALTRTHAACSTSAT